MTVDGGLQRGLCEDERGQWTYCNLEAGIVSVRYSAFPVERGGCELRQFQLGTVPSKRDAV